MVDQPRCVKMHCEADAEWLPKISRPRTADDPPNALLMMVMDLPVCTAHRSFGIDRYVAHLTTIEHALVAKDITDSADRRDLRVTFVPIRGRGHPFEKYRA